MKTDDEKRRKLKNLIIVVLAAMFALGGVACVICIAVLKNNVLFIPMALAFSAALILFTYSRNKAD